MSTIYLDTLATAIHRPDTVTEAAARLLREGVGLPSRSGHRLARAAARVVFEAREATAQLLRVNDSREVHFTLSGTQAAGTLLHGLLRPGAHVVAGPYEHDSILLPLEQLARSRGIRIDTPAAGIDGTVSPEAVASCVRDETALVALSTGSTVTGGLNRVEGYRQAARGAILLVDGRATFGVVPVDLAGWGVDAFIFSGHTWLMAPPGVAGFFVRRSLGLPAVHRGGTVDGSGIPPQEAGDLYHDNGMPDLPGLAALSAAASFNHTHRAIDTTVRELHLARVACEGVRELPGVRLLGPAEPERRTALVSFVVEGRDAREIGELLDRRYAILAGYGRFNAGTALRRLGLDGAVRFSPGYFNTENEVAVAVGRLGELIGKKL